MADHEMLQRFYRATKIPLQLFNKLGLIINFDTTGYNSNPALHILGAALKSEQPVCLTVSNYFFYCGVVRIDHSDEYVVAGPTMDFECTALQAQKVLSKMGHPHSGRDEFIRWTGAIPTCDLERFRSVLLLLDYELNGRTNRGVIQVPYSEEDVPVSPYQADMSFIEHHTNFFEKRLTSCIEYGRPEELEHIFDRMLSRNGQIPLIAPDAIRSYKNIILMAISLVSRTALRGGMDRDTSISLTDYYLPKIESLYSYESLSALFKQICLDFAQRIARINTLSSDSIIVKRIVGVVSSCLYEKVTPTSIAGRLGMNCSYLCRHFKKETGKTISTYINEIKIMECKRLLISTNMPIVQISSQLGFSSQNYLHYIFRKITGVTPAEYRKERYRRRANLQRS
jgi:AraC-like DNA-binding protein